MYDVHCAGTVSGSGDYGNSIDIREGWRKSTHYSDDVSVAIHLMMKHTADKEAYAMAMLLE